MRAKHKQKPMRLKGRNRLLTTAWMALGFLAVLLLLAAPSDYMSLFLVTSMICFCGSVLFAVLAHKQKNRV